VIVGDGVVVLGSTVGVDVSVVEEVVVVVVVVLVVVVVVVGRDGS